MGQVPMCAFVTVHSGCQRLDMVTRRYCHFVGDLLKLQQQLPRGGHFKLAVPPAVAAPVVRCVRANAAAGDAVPVDGAQGSQSLKGW